MANLTKDRATQKLASSVYEPLLGPYDIPANGKVYKGGMYALDANSRVVAPSLANAALKVAGVATDGQDNTGGANGALKAEVQTGIHKWDKDATHPPAVADVFKHGYATDDHTISNTQADGSDAGVIVLIESDGVWVYTNPLAY